jgi:hypothetical protein
MGTCLSCSGQRKFSIKDAEKPAPEYYDPVICECIQWIKNHVLLREKRLDTAKFVCRVQWANTRPALDAANILF